MGSIFEGGIPLPHTPSRESIPLSAGFALRRCRGLVPRSGVLSDVNTMRSSIFLREMNLSEQPTNYTISPSLSIIFSSSLLSVFIITMVRVAVAGGSGSIGRAIFDAVDDNPSHEAFILSRTSSDDPKVIAVNYSDVEKLQEALETHQIYCVISALAIRDDEGGQAQMNLIEAAVRSRPTVRFMPSEFGAKYDEEYVSRRIVVL